jgi:hypothetical protein
MLIARYTCQEDILRAHLLLGYTFLETLLVLATFCLSRSMAGSATAGYLSAALLFVLAIPLPALWPSAFPWANYTTLWPHASSTVEPTLLTTPQMYSGIFVSYGIFLGIAEVCRRLGNSGASWPILLATSLLVGCLLRFRVQIFLVLLPVWLLLLGLTAWKNRRPLVLLHAGLTLFISGLLILEMHLPVYLPGSTQVRFGEWVLWSHPIVLSWPGAGWALRAAAWCFPQYPSGFACQATFLNALGVTLVNIVGVPLLLLSLLCLFSRAVPSWGRLFAGTLGLLVFLSIIEGACLTVPYCPWSLGGEMLINAGWFLFPCSGTALFILVRACSSRLRLFPLLPPVIGCAILLAAFAWQVIRPPSVMGRRMLDKKILVIPDEYAALEFIRKETPADTVLMTNHLHGRNCAIAGAVSGRRVYLDYVPSLADLWTDPKDSDDARAKTILRVWSAQTREELQAALPPYITHLLDFRDTPLRASHTGMLERVYRSPAKRVTLWRVVADPLNPAEGPGPQQGAPPSEPRP